MIVVDTSVWADHFNGVTTPFSVRLGEAIDREEPIGMPPIILTEVLMGFRTERGFRRAREILSALPILLLDAEGHVEAARLFRKLRAAGVTVRGAIDGIVAQTCLATDSTLVSPDSDFRHIARTTRLRLWSPG